MFTLRRQFLFLFAAMMVPVVFAVPPASALPMNKLFFLHHSTGQNLINQGDVREWLASYNAQNGSDFRFWDHDYNYIGLRRADGSNVGWIYNIPNDNTDPIGLYNLWTTANAARDSILPNHEVIAFKSCYPASAIYTPQILQQYQTWYLAIRDVFDQHPDKIFVVMSPPPLHRLATNLTQADNARTFANWLKSAEYLQATRISSASTSSTLLPRPTTRVRAPGTCCATSTRSITSSTTPIPTPRPTPSSDRSSRRPSSTQQLGWRPESELGRGQALYR